jgi:uncharacterized repeat protein (TIGR01451 family)
MDILHFSKLSILFGLALLVLGVPAIADQHQPIELTTVVESEIVEKNAQGKEVIKRVPAAKVVPGDEVIYTTRFKYNGEDPATDIVITNPIPQFTQYRIGSASGDNTVIQYSVNNGQSFHSTDQLKVQDETGKEKAAEAEDYTDIRWTYRGQLEKGDEGMVEFRVVLK